MKSIYSLPVMQSILDHFGVGTIRYITYFDYIGRQVWRHFIETDRGEFELYSFPTELHTYAVERIEQSPAGHRGILKPTACHSFDRYHLLKQLSKKIPIPQSQLELDFQIVNGQKITKIFRVYGTILQARWSDDSVFCSYGKWRLRNEKENLLIDSSTSSRNELDFVIDTLASKNLMYESFTIDDDETLSLFFSQGYIFSFRPMDHFAALEVRLSGKHKDIRFYGEKKIYYLKEL